MVLCLFQAQQIHDMEEVCYNKVLEQVKAGHQVNIYYIFKLTNLHRTVWERVQGFE